MENGRYRGSRKEIAYDGLWQLPDGPQIVVEVKTTDVYRIDLNVVAGYRKRLIKQTDVLEDDISVLIVVGRQDTGDLEAQIRGSKHAWDIRLISADALLRLLAIKEEAEDPGVSARIRSILIPQEYTRVDDIIALVFAATEDLKEEEATSIPADRPEGGESDGPKFVPVKFNEACADLVGRNLDVALVRRSRAYFVTADETVGVLCAVSKEHDAGTSPNYWFAFHPHQQEWLEAADKAFVCFGCGSPEKTVMIPYRLFSEWLGGMNQTHRGDGRSYWHVQIYDKDGILTLHRKKGTDWPDLTKFLLRDS